MEALLTFIYSVPAAICFLGLFGCLLYGVGQWRMERNWDRIDEECHEEEQKAYYAKIEKELRTTAKAKGHETSWQMSAMETITLMSFARQQIPLSCVIKPMVRHELYAKC